MLLFPLFLKMEAIFLTSRFPWWGCRGEGGGGIKVYMLLFLLFLKMEAIIFLTSRGVGGGQN